MQSWSRNFSSVGVGAGKRCEDAIPALPSSPSSSMSFRALFIISISLLACFPLPPPVAALLWC